MTMKKIQTMITKENTKYMCEIFAEKSVFKQNEKEISNQKPKPGPKMKVGGFSSDGRLIFEFDQEMFIPDSLKNYTLKTETIESD